MSRSRKSPQEKKHLEYTKDHFTFGFDSSRNFPKTWKRKKTLANREYRSKSDQLLARTKPGTEAGEATSLSEDMTANLFRKSVLRKILKKAGTVSVGEKVKLKLERRSETANRRVLKHETYDKAAADAVSILSSLQGALLAESAMKAYLVLIEKKGNEIERLRQSRDPIDRALHFLYRASWSAAEKEAICRSPQLHDDLAKWRDRVNRILARERRKLQRKLEEQQALKSKLRGSSKR